MPALLASMQRFAGDERGNLAVIFALACLPLLSAVGCAVDYSRAVQVRSKLQAAADAASLGAIARSSNAMKFAARMNYDGLIPGAADAVSYFNANVSGVTGFRLESLAPEVRKTGDVVTATVSFRASIPAYFLGILGTKALVVSGQSVAQVSVPIVFRRVGGQVVYQSAPHLVVAGPDGSVKSGASPTQGQQITTTVTVTRKP